MSIASIARVSNLLTSTMLTNNIGNTQQQMLEIENELSTGKAVNQPSDNPSAAASIQQLQQTLASRTGWSANVSEATGQLSQADTTLNSVGTMLQTAISTASANASTTVSADARSAAAVTVDSLYTEAMTLANTQYNGSYLFGGDNSGNAPYVQVSQGVQYNGTSGTLSNTFDDNSSVNFQVSGNSVFGGLTAAAGTSSNLSPTLAANTRISDLGGATSSGVMLGSIDINDGTHTKTIDLSQADSVQDVLDDINNAGLNGVTASVAGSSIKLTAAAGTNITVTDAGGGETAEQLGIYTPTAAGVGVAITGQSVQPRVTDFTQLSALNNGAGITGSFTITNGSQTKTISTAGLTTVDQLMNAINTSGTGVKAQINAAGTGIAVYNTVQGSSLSISEDGGATATDLGIRTFTPATTLASLNGGKGVGVVTGDDIGITSANGTETDVDLSNATTVQDVINAINTAGAGNVTASFATTGNGIVLTDHTTGAGSLNVKNLNGSTAATDLGLTGDSIAGVLQGTDVNTVATTGVFADLQKLSDALKSNDTAGITEAAENLQNDYNQVTDVRGMAGAVNQQLQGQTTQISDENTATQTLLSQLQDVDYTTAVTQLDTLQTSYQAALATASTVLDMSLADYIA